MVSPELIQLVERLSTKTSVGEIDWKESIAENVFQVALSRNSVRLKREGSATRSPLYTIELVNDVGSIVETVTDAELDSDLHGIMDGPYFALMADMYAAARRRALGADRVLREVLRDLE